MDFFDKINIKSVSYNVKDTTARQQISDETTAREQEDTKLSQQISDETTARERADTNLQNQIGSAVNRKPNWVSVTSFGADNTGAADATSAFSAACGDSDFVYVPAGTYLLNTSPAVRDKNVLFFEPNTALTGSGADIFYKTVDQTTPGGMVYWAAHYAVPTTIASHNIRSAENFSGGTPGTVHSALHIYDVVQNAACALYEWAMLARLDNHANGGENVASYMQARKFAEGPTWATVAEVFQSAPVTNPTTGLVGVEVDLNVNNTDDNFNRVGLHIVVRKNDDISSTSQNQAGAGVRIDATQEDALFRKGIEFLGHYGIGLDFEHGEFVGNVIQTVENQQIKVGRWTTNGTVRTGESVSQMAQAQIPVVIDGQTYYIPLYTS